MVQPARQHKCCHSPFRRVQLPRLNRKGKRLMVLEERLTCVIYYLLICNMLLSFSSKIQILILTNCRSGRFNFKALNPFKIQFSPFFLLTLLMCLNLFPKDWIRIRSISNRTLNPDCEEGFSQTCNSPVFDQPVSLLYNPGRRLLVHLIKKLFVLANPQKTFKETLIIYVLTPKELENCRNTTYSYMQVRRERLKGSLNCHK